MVALAQGVSAEAAPRPEEGRDASGWLTTARVGFSLRYDDNAYFQRLGELANRSSWVVAVEPRIDLRLARPTVERPTTDLRIAYEAAIERYGRWSEQGHDRHRLLFSFHSRGDRSRVEMLNEISITEGRAVAQEWPSPQGLPRSPVIGGPEFRSRTANREIRGRISARRELGGGWFVRPRAQWWASDFRTEQRETPIPNPEATFYGNYVDRADLHGGFDLGRRVGPAISWVLGYRMGAQDQGRLIGSPYQYDNRYQVLLVGLEGRPSDRFSYALQVGPDFRSYGPGVRPGENRSPTEVYLQGRFSWVAFPRLSAEGRLRHFRFMPGGGQGAMTMTLADLGLRKGLSPAVTLHGGIRLLGGSIRPPDPRGTDWLFTSWLRVRWQESERRALSLELALDDGWSEEEDVYRTPAGPIPGPNGSGREYSRRIIELSVEIVLD